MRLFGVASVFIESKITAMNESNDLKFSQHMMNVRKMIVHDASINAKSELVQSCR